MAHDYLRNISDKQPTTRKKIERLSPPPQKKGDDTKMSKPRSNLISAIDRNLFDFNFPLNGHISRNDIETALQHIARMADEDNLIMVTHSLNLTHSVYDEWNLLRKETEVITKSIINKEGDTIPNARIDVEYIQNNDIDKTVEVFILAHKEMCDTAIDFVNKDATHKHRQKEEPVSTTHFRKSLYSSEIIKSRHYQSMPTIYDGWLNASDNFMYFINKEMCEKTLNFFKGLSQQKGCSIESLSA